MKIKLFHLNLSEVKYLDNTINDSYEDINKKVNERLKLFERSVNQNIDYYQFPVEIIIKGTVSPNGSLSKENIFIHLGGGNNSKIEIDINRIYNTVFGVN